MSRTVRLIGVSAVFLVLAIAAVVAQPDSPRLVFSEVAPVTDEPLADHREPPAQPPPAAVPAPKPPVARPAPAPAGTPQSFEVVCPPLTRLAAHPPTASPALDMGTYENLGAWVDVFDYAIRNCLDPVASAEKMAALNVKTLYLQTSRFKQPQEIVWPEAVDQFLQAAHSRGIRVVGWYVPGFGNLDRDLSRSLAVLNYVSPSGHRFDGFAADIENREEFAGDVGRFNAGIAAYSQKLREATPGAVLGAIVVDAKNNERAPARWQGFPWGDIGRNFDVILPMAYWTVTKASAPGCLATEMNTTQYIREVAQKTEALMGTKKPMHVIGGIGDCLTHGEVAGYVNAAKEVGSIGGSLYDFDTVQTHPAGQALWAELANFNP